jgi:hypothetical protein
MVPAYGEPSDVSSKASDGPPFIATTRGRFGHWTALVEGSQVLLHLQPFVAQQGKLLGQTPKRFLDQFRHNFGWLAPGCTDALLRQNTLFRALVVTADHC